MSTEELQEQNKKLQKEVKGCDKMVKNWPCYKGLEDSVKNVQSSLPLVEELRSKAMRDRHWKQVMKPVAPTSRWMTAPISLSPRSR